MQLTYQPVGPLASFVEKLWYCDGRNVLRRQQRVLPNGRFQLFISLSDGPLGGVGSANWEVGRSASSLVVGIQTRFSVIDTGLLESAMGVLFHPGGARSFFDAPADVFYNDRVPLDLIWGPTASTLRDRLREIRTAAEKFDVLETALLERMNRRLELHAAVLYGLEQFARAPNIHSVLDVTKEAGLSRRRFAQLFREQIGLTPKLYCRLRRFQRVVREISSGVPVDWADVALAGGYYDQAHLADEFRHFSGTSPSAYLSAERSQVTSPSIK
jgi:AraC-like DNA-binding protein